MKTIEIQLFKFDELSDKAKEKALIEYYDWNVNFDWWDSVYYDAKNLSYNIICTAIAPMIDIIDYGGNYVNTLPFFWIPVYNYQSTLDYSSSNINYAINTRISLDFNKADVVKSIDKPIDALFNFIFLVKLSNSVTRTNCNQC
jgi:hypothetical protein